MRSGAASTRGRARRAARTPPRSRGSPPRRCPSRGPRPASRRRSQAPRRPRLDRPRPCGGAARLPRRAPRARRAPGALARRRARPPAPRARARARRARARARGARWRAAHLEVRSNDAGAQAFYERLGFRAVGRRRRLLPGGSDASCHAHLDDRAVEPAGDSPPGARTRRRACQSLVIQIGYAGFGRADEVDLPSTSSVLGQRLAKRVSGHSGRHADLDRAHRRGSRTGAGGRRAPPGPAPVDAAGHRGHAERRRPGADRALRGRVARDRARSSTRADAIPVRYQLEVSSPGLDRVLAREKDFAAACGREVRARDARAARRAAALPRPPARVRRRRGAPRRSTAPRSRSASPTSPRANAVYEFTRDDFAQRTGGSGR